MASVYTGFLPASRMLRKLNAYHFESGLYKALREVGRIEKTNFLLRYFTVKGLRREVQAALNRQESLHALARTLYIGHRGEVRMRDLEGQVNQFGCLQLVMAMVITWNAAYISAAIDRLRTEGVSIKDEQLAHILPLMSAHINLFGRYEFASDPAAYQTDISALPLRSTDTLLEQLGLEG